VHRASRGGVVDSVPEPITERPGSIIGPYKLMEQIGEGGMGLVFVAEQQHPAAARLPSRSSSRAWTHGK
jgi:hypothetical protein